MAINDRLLPREELISLWQEIARSFNSELELTVDNDTSLTMRFVFQNGYGKTQVGIKDLPGSGFSHISSFESYVITDLKALPIHKLGISLPPLLGRFIKRYRTDVSTLDLGDSKYWVKSQSDRLRRAVTDEKAKELKDFDSLYLSTSENQLVLKSQNFLGKAHQIKALINLHFRFLELISQD